MMQYYFLLFLQLYLIIQLFMLVKLFWRTSAEVASPVTKESEIVQLRHYGHSEELRESLFLHFSPIIHELCSHVRLSDKHIIHCLCRYLGVPTATIAYCLHTTVRSLSKDKTRLQQKLPENYAVILLGNGNRRGRPKSL